MEILEQTEKNIDKNIFGVLFTQFPCLARFNKLGERRLRDLKISLTEPRVMYFY